MLRGIYGLALAGALGAANTPPMPGPAPPPATGGRAAANAGCVGCHEPIAREWEASLHRVSAIDEPYVAAYNREPLRFCRKCHVPEARPDRPPPAWAEALGVGCVTCHVTAGRAVLAAPGEGRAPHPVTRSPAFAGPDACAACHTFGFPDAALRDEPTPMQATVAEHADSWARDYACADCHMPWVEDAAGGHRSHAFAASRDPGMLARAVGVSARRVDAGEVEVTLTPGAAGHAFPTGDLFRRLELRVAVVGPGGPRRPLVVRLGRTFASRAQSSGLIVRDEVEDTRVHDAPVVLRFDLTEAPGPELSLCEDLSRMAVTWELRYQRVAFPDGRRRGGAALDGEAIVAFGELPGAE
jgi:hypothetical protein